MTKHLTSLICITIAIAGVAVFFWLVYLFASAEASTPTTEWRMQIEGAGQLPGHIRVYVIRDRHTGREWLVVNTNCIAECTPTGATGDAPQSTRRAQR